MNSQAKYVLHKAVVLKNEEVAPETFLLSFKRSFDFLPGQVIALTTDKKLAPRLYSIASGNKDKNIEIIYDIKTEGELTPKLSKLNDGEEIHYSLPFGEFIDKNEPAYWIATGTGIAPFVSMVKSGLSKDKKLIQGARSQHLFYFAEFFEKQLGGNYFRCCSQCEQGLFFKGRLTSFLKDCDDLNTKEKFYLCGSAEMVVDVRDILIGKGVPFNNIISEIYF